MESEILVKSQSSCHQFQTAVFCLRRWLNGGTAEVPYSNLTYSLQSDFKRIFEIDCQT